MSLPQTALKFEAEVTKEGRIELPVPFPAGARVVVFVIEQGDDVSPDLLSAAQSSLKFWDNSYDDEDWNNA
jgi:hypothetical protein